MQHLNWQYPSWYLIFCVLLGVAAAVLLYRKDSTFKDQNQGLRALMAFLRGLVVTVLSFLLLAPLLKLIQHRTEPPVIVIAQDQSVSIREGMTRADSTTYFDALNKLAATLEKKFVVHKVGFGEEVKPVDQWMLDDQASDLGGFMTYLDEQYKGQNVGAVIVASDGAINRGRNPLYVSAGLKAPLSVIALGDTIRKTDLLVRDVFNNSIVYLGDRFSVQTDIASVRLAGATSALEIRHIQGNQNVLLERVPVSITTDAWFDTHEFIVEAKQSGVQRYRVQLTQVKNEVTYVNNVRDFFVEVIDGRLNVLLLANSPHPDLAVWKASLEAQRNYEVKVEMVTDFSAKDLPKYDLVILHQLPSSKNLINGLLEDINKLAIPKIFVTGYQTDIYAFNYAQSLVNIGIGESRSPNEVTMVLNPGFNSFNTSDDFKNKIGSFSPLISPYGEYTPSPSAQILAFQRIGSVETQFPLILMGEANDVRTCVVAGEGIWKWQLYDQLQNGSKEITHELLSQLCQYASTKSDKRKFRANTPKKLFTELEDISFQAELFNDNYELTNAPEVLLIVRNEKREEFDYSFNTSGQSYVLQIGRYPEGSYTYTASTELNGVRHSHEGKFVVQAVQLESMSSTADHGLLRQLAENHAGAFVYGDQMDQLADRILDNTAIKPVLYSSTQTRPLIHFKWLCLILLLGLSLEWFLRRFYGGY